MNWYSTYKNNLYTTANISKRDWEKVDWSKSNEEIAREIGSSSDMAYRKRKEFAPHTIRMYRREEDWSQVNWGKSNEEIAQEFGVHKVTVEKLRSKYAPNTLRVFVDWGLIDWSKSSEQIAIENNVSLSRVYETRKLFAPQTMNHELVNKGINWSVVGPQINWDKKNEEIAKELGVGCSLVSKYRKKYSPNVLKMSLINRLYNWGDVDWNKSDKEIAYFLMEELKKKYNIDSSEITDMKIERLRRYVKQRRFFRSFVR